MKFPRNLFKSQDGKNISGFLLVQDQDECDKALAAGWFTTHPDALLDASKKRLQLLEDANKPEPEPEPKAIVKPEPEPEPKAIVKPVRRARTKKVSP
jgi:hypothetical protein